MPITDAIKILEEHISFLNGEGNKQPNLEDLKKAYETAIFEMKLSISKYNKTKFKQLLPFYCQSHFQRNIPCEHQCGNCKAFYSIANNNLNNKQNNL